MFSGCKSWTKQQNNTYRNDDFDLFIQYVRPYCHPFEMWFVVDRFTSGDVYSHLTSSLPALTLKMLTRPWHCLGLQGGCNVALFTWMCHVQQQYHLSNVTCYFIFAEPWATALLFLGWRWWWWGEGKTACFYRPPVWMSPYIDTKWSMQKKKKGQSFIMSWASSIEYSSNLVLYLFRNFWFLCPDHSQLQPFLRYFPLLSMSGACICCCHMQGQDKGWAEGQLPLAQRSKGTQNGHRAVNLFCGMH